jgi:prepilin-type N-terminal cleavage/methylation domain-containing protein
MAQRKAFTLVEVLISVALLALIIVPLFSVVDMMKRSNTKLADALEETRLVSKATKVLYLDILGSDGRLTIKKDEFTRLCIEETSNSLYALPVAKVCWLVLKKQNTLARIEGNYYKIPLDIEDRVEVDRVMTGVDVFDVYQQKDKVLVLLQQKDEEPISFMLQGITNPVQEILADGTQVMKDGRKILPDGTVLYKDGSKLLPNGTVVPAPAGTTTTNDSRQETPATPTTPTQQPTTTTP